MDIKERAQFELTVKGNTTRHSERVKKKGQNDSFSTFGTLGMVGDIGFTIAIPIVLGALIGKFLDTRVTVYPRGILGGLLVGIFISVIGFIAKIKELLTLKD